MKNNNMSKKGYLFAKRTFDLVTASGAILVLTPIFFIVAVIIKFESKGPIFFIQKRLGMNGKEFNIYKFRTMVVGAEKVGNGIFVKKDDDRITRVGAFLRKTSLDELPQLINVIKGDMSIVGPRPPVTYHPNRYEDYSDYQRQRFYVKPGITGYAQAIGRNNLTWNERIDLDVYYVNNRTILGDIKIIIRTASTLFKKDTIYGDKRKKETV